MSRAVTVPEFDVFLDKVVQKIRAIAKVPFPKVEEIVPILNLDYVPGQTYARKSATSDYALGRPTLDMMNRTEAFSPLAAEIPVGLETFMPLEFPMQTPQKGTSKRPVVALPHNRVLELPMVNQVLAQKEPIKRSLDAKDLENLLAAFKENGMDVKEVKLLPSGTTRITFDEFFGTMQDRKPEFVQVRGRR